ncbi:MAG: hypothetical protein OHK0012_09520 [Synechococcales cyanobacterium]
MSPFMDSKQIVMSALGLMLVGCSSSNTAPFQATPRPAQVQTIAMTAVNGAPLLDSPRGMTFGPDGLLYIAEGGRGPETFDPTQPTIPSPSVPGAQLQYGTTGAIARLNVNTGSLERVVTGLPSTAIPLGSPVTEAAGIDGLGPTDIAFGANGQLLFLLGFGSAPNNRTLLGTGAEQMASLAAADVQANSFQVLADLGTFEATNNPAQDDLITNPYRLVTRTQDILMVDAGANVLLKTDLAGGGLGVEAVFDDVRTVPAPPFIPAPTVDMQQVPIAVALNPATQVFVAEYTGFPFPAGLARIFRLEGSTPVVSASDFTNIADIEFDAQGNLWVLEYDSDSVLGGEDFGGLIQISPTGAKRRITELDGRLVTPTGLAVDNAGSVYIANKGFRVGEGEIIKVSF